MLLSIQSLLAANPYTLEPGFDDPDKHDEVEYMEAYKSKASNITGNGPKNPNRVNTYTARPDQT